MGRRPDPSQSDRPFTTEEVAELHRKLALLSPYHVIKTYREAYERCRMNGEMLPKAAAIQELVTAWKVLRDSKRNLT